MSWQDKNNTPYQITTGDGKVFGFEWMNVSKNIEFNIAQFDFKETEGTLVYRGTPRGTKYAIELYLQGDDHLDQSADFEASAKDPRPWTIAHPYYGNILVQPIALTYDNSDYNVTKITGGVIATISTTPDKPTTSAPDKIAADKDETDMALAETYANDVPEPKVADIQDMISNASGTYNAALGSIKNAVNLEALTNAYNLALAAATNADINTIGAITSIQTMLSAPAKFADTVANRIGMLGNMLSYLFSTVPGINSLAGKKLFENNGGSLISSLILASITGTGGAYGNRTTVLNTIGTLVGSFNSYLGFLNNLQSINGGFPGAYIPNATGIRLLTQLVNYGVNALLDIAASSRQERSFFLEEASNVILLAYRLYGLTADDSTINDFMNANEIGLNEILEIKKGRKITYYV